jgi:hypothetical protein
MNIVFWFAKFEVYQRIIFPTPRWEARASDSSSTHGSNGTVAVELGP